MNTLTCVGDLRECYTHNDSFAYFKYFPLSGVIRCHSRMNMFKVLHLLGTCGIDVDWNKTNIMTFVIQLPPLCDEQDDIVITQLLDFCQPYEDIISSEKYKNNVDNRTGRMLQWSSLKVQMSNMISSKSFDRVKTANWFNSFNIETIRPEEPLMIVSTKSKATIVDEGKKWLERLYAEGKLIKYTKDELKTKLEKYGKSK
jgi:hypothetical protein